jgi:uncharacterized protein YkwD
MNRTSFRLADIIIAGLLALSMVSCAGPRPVPSDRIPAERTKPRINVEELETRIHALINKERRNHGLSSLSWNSALSKIAGKHSRDMAKRKYFDHQSPEGHGFSDRYKKGGYSCSVPVKATIYTGAENIFQNNLYDRVVYVNGAARYDWNSMQKIAETTVQGWMKSPGHRKNILTPHWRSEGIGVSIAPDDKVYITQNFC